VKYLLKYIITFFVLSVFLISCSSDENANDESSTNEPVLSSILISSDFSFIEGGNTVTFSAVTNLGADVTDEVIFSVGGTLISGNTYVFQQQGSFVVTAIYNNITSNSIVINVTVLLTSINLSSNSQSYFLGDLVEFSIIGNNGIDLTEQSTISILGGGNLSSNIYATSAEGMFSFIATYDDFTSVVYDINILPAPTRFNQNVLIEDYTGTWCGYCPRISHAIDLVNQQTSEAVVVAIHRGSSDPYNFPAGVLEDLINLLGYPTAMLNRTTEWNNPEPNNVNQVINLTSGLADVGLAIGSSLDGFGMNINVKVKFGGQFSHSSAKLVLYVLEDGLLFDQSNNTSYYGGSTVISNFEHNHVLRASLSNLMGDQIPATEYSEDNVYQVNYTSAIPSNISVNENMTLVAFVTNEYNAALNVRVANFGETQIFEEL
jgi:thiol-disulfide isomerase/thioredoxin